MGRHLIKEMEHQGKDVLGYGRCAISTDITDRDLEVLRGFGIDIVITGSGDANAAQFG